MVFIFVELNDVVTPAGIDSTWVADRFFGPYPSVADYMATVSGGRLLLSPAPETVGYPNDGVVNLIYDGFLNMVNGDPATEAGLALKAADPLIDFSVFDVDDDGSIDDRELTVSVVRIASPAVSTSLPDPGQVVFFMVRASQPSPGSWELRSDGLERTVNCP